MPIIKLIPKEEIDIIIPLLQTLNTSIDSQTLTYRLEEMKQNSYKAVGAFKDGKLIAICGFWILVKYYVGKHIEPDNVMVMPEYRNQKIGEKMMRFIYEYGKNNGCLATELNCYITNSAGIKFWINQGYMIIGYHFQKML